MTDLVSSNFTIVVGLDFTDAGMYAFGQAARISRAIPGSHIHLVHVGKTELDEVSCKQLLGQFRLYVNEKAKFLGGLAGATVAIHLRAGDPVREIAQLATEVTANMIVLGAHKLPHMKSWVLGTVSHRLLETATCPVLVAGPRPTAAKHEPAIEPPCPDCLRARAASKNAKWWCERHAQHAAKAHIFSYQTELPMATHDSEIIPTGIDF